MVEATVRTSRHNWSPLQRKIISYLPHLQEFADGYLKYLAKHHLRLHKLVTSMDVRLVKSSLRIFFHEAAHLSVAVPDSRIYEVMAEHTEQEVRSKLNAFSRKLWSKSPMPDR